MKRNTIRTAALPALASVVLSVSSDANASILLGEGVGGLNSAGSPGNYETVHFKFGVSPAYPMPGHILLDLTGVDESFVGQTFTIDQNNAPEWDDAIALMTNGENNSMYYWRQFEGHTGSGQGWFAQSWLFSNDPETPDFQGAIIDYIEFEFLTFTIDQEGGWTYMNNLSFRVSVYGTIIPSPGVATALIVAGCMRRRRRR